MSGTESKAAKGIAIPFDREALGEFIVGLLGQRRTIERTFSDRRFEIDMNWLLNLDQIIEQRLASQNSGKLVSFSIRLYLENGKIITLGSQNDFRAFNDMSSELSVGVDIRWTYLIQFPLAKLPEKQELRFLAFTQPDVTARKIDGSKSRLFTSDPNSERLAYSIQFTDITWGEDLSAHISNYITAKTDPIRKWKRYFRKMRPLIFTPLLLTIGMALTSFSMLSGINSTQSAARQIYGNFSDIPSRMVGLNEKIDFLVHMQALRLQSDFPALLPAIKAALLYIVAIGFIFLVMIRKPSTIELNEHSRRAAKRSSRNYNILVFGVILGLVVGVVAGVLTWGLIEGIRPYIGF